jgi:hypothetical protein
MLQWLQQQYGLTIKSHTLMSGASTGQASMCDYLHLQQRLLYEGFEPFESFEDLCYVAAYGGHTDTLLWLIEHDCPYDAATLLEAAAEGGSVAVMQCLLQQGIMPTAAQMANLLNITGACNKLEAAQWLRKQGAEWPVVLNCWHPYFKLMLVWRDAVLAWARAEGCISPI